MTINTTVLAFLARMPGHEEQRLLLEDAAANGPTVYI